MVKMDCWYAATSASIGRWAGRARFRSVGAPAARGRGARAAVAVAVLAAGFGVLPALVAAPGAYADTVNIPATIVVDSKTSNGTCVVADFIQFADTPGVVSYAASVDDTARGHLTFSGPPFDDTFTPFPDVPQATFTAPAGTHRFFLTAGAGGTCKDVGAGRFSNLTVTGTLAPTAAPAITIPILLLSPLVRWEASQL